MPYHGDAIYMAFSSYRITAFPTVVLLDFYLLHHVRCGT